MTKMKFPKKYSKWFAEIGTKGGSARSEAKARASRLNGLKGGLNNKCKKLLASKPNRD